MIARELSESKAQKLRKQSLKKKFPVLVVRSEWITDSIKGKLWRKGDIYLSVSMRPVVIPEDF